jgi:hypothetical protein
MEQSRRLSIEYTEFDFVDADQQHNQPLLADESDEESSLDMMEPKQYKLPSEGGTIFSSFVSSFPWYTVSKRLFIFLLAEHGQQYYRSWYYWLTVCI